MSSFLYLSLPVLAVVGVILAGKRWVSASPRSDATSRAREVQSQLNQTFAGKLESAEQNLQQFVTEAAQGSDRGPRALAELLELLGSWPSRVSDVVLRDRAWCLLTRWNLHWGFSLAAEDCLGRVVENSDAKQSLRRQLLRRDRHAFLRPPPLVRPLRLP